MGKVVKIVPFGAFVEVLRERRISAYINIAHERINNVEDVLKVGDEILVKVTDIDNQGRINLSGKLFYQKKMKI